MNEIIYILTNEAMSGYVKIGRTNNNLEQRVRDLSASTSVPLPFTVFYACTVKDAQFVEHQLHDAFDDNRVNPKKDFVESKEDQEALNTARKIRSKFNFEMVKIPIGAELYFSRDESIKAKVVDTHAANSIESNGKKTSLSRSAQKILGYQYGVAGTDYWMYEGETLAERRSRMESGIEYSDKEVEAAGDAWMQQQADIERGK